MSSELFELVVPASRRALSSAARLLAAAQIYAEREQLPLDALLKRRLHPDMFPLHLQLEILCSAIRGTILRLTGRLAESALDPEYAVFIRGAASEFEEAPPALSHMHSAFETLQRGLATLQPRDFSKAPEAKITLMKPGEQRHFDSTRSFVHGHFLPNLYFHLSMVYALLRAAGVPIGKEDFIAGADCAITHLDA